MSLTIMARKCQVLSPKNPSNTPSYLNGPAGQRQYYQSKSTNLAKSTYSFGPSNQIIIVDPSEPQPSVKSFGTYMKNRITFGSAYNQSNSNLIDLCCPKNKYNNVVKIFNQSHYDMSTYLSTRNTRAIKCTINPNSSYNDPSSQFFTEYTELVNGVAVTKCCNKSIDKITKTSDIETYLRAKYLQNNCLPPPTPSPTTDNPDSTAINTQKLRYNNIKGGSCEC